MSNQNNKTIQLFGDNFIFSKKVLFFCCFIAVFNYNFKKLIYFYFSRRLVNHGQRAAKPGSRTFPIRRKCFNKTKRSGKEERLQKRDSSDRQRRLRNRVGTFSILRFHDLPRIESEVAPDGGLAKRVGRKRSHHSVSQK